MIIIINWAVYNQWFLSKGLFWKEKRKSPFSTWGFWFMWMGKGGSGTCWGFAWFLPAEVAPAAAHPGPQNRAPPPHPDHGARGARPPDRFQDSAAAETRCDPVACTVFPGLLPPLSLLDLPLPGLPAAPAPSLAPTPVFPVRILPAGWWPGRSAVGEATPDRMAMTWDMATVTPTFLSHGPGSHRPHRVCVGTVGLEFGFSFVLFLFCFVFLLILASFSKMGN